MKNIWNRFCWGVGLGISLILILTSCGQTSKKEIPIEVTANHEDSQMKNETEKQNDQLIYVQLCGAVVNPGIYPCQEGDYLFSIIEKAGGLLETACFESVNQAQTVVDGQMIMVYSKDEFSLMKTGNGTKSNEESDVAAKVNLNTADAVKLMSLPGIGEAKAAQIIEYRRNNGFFTKIEDIMNIGGIKEHLFETIKDAICVN